MKINTPNGSYWVEEYGANKGNPVVLLHGFTGSSATWYPFLPYLNNHRTILIDLPGHRSTKVQMNSMKDFCDDLAYLLTKLKIEKATLIGYSLGGRTALSFAIYYPERVHALLLESATAGIEQEEERIKRQQSDEELANFIEDHGLEVFVDRWQNIPLFQTQKSLPASKKATIRAERLSHSVAGLALSLRTMGTGKMPSWWSDLASIQIPVQLVVGALDHKFVSINQKMDKMLPNSSFIKVENAGHAVHVEQPEFFGTIIKNIGNGGDFYYDS